MDVSFEDNDDTAGDLSRDLEEIKTDLEIRRQIRNGAILNETVFNLVKKSNPTDVGGEFRISTIVNAIKLMMSYTASCNTAFPMAMMSYVNTLAYLDLLVKEPAKYEKEIGYITYQCRDGEMTLYTLFQTIGCDTLMGRINALKRLAIPNNPIADNEFSEALQRKRIEELNMELASMHLRNKELEEKVKELTSIIANSSVTQTLIDAQQPKPATADETLKSIQRSSKTPDKNIDETLKSIQRSSKTPDKNIDETLKSIQKSIKKLQEQATTTTTPKTTTTVSGGKTGADLIQISETEPNKKSSESQRLIRTFMSRRTESDLTPEDIDDLKQLIYNYPQFAVMVYAKFPSIIKIK